MAVKLISNKMADRKVKPLEIYAPREGIAPSPHLGYGDMRNLDIFTVPGVAKLNNILAKESATTVDAQIKWIVKNPASPANLYAIDSNGSVYTSANSGDTWSEVSDRGGAGEGLIVWKDYLFVFETTSIDVYGPLSSSPTWTDGWQTIGTAAWHPAIISKNDGKVYFGCGRYIGSIEENNGQDFAPGTSATYTVTLGTSASNALDLPEDYKIKCLEELGNNLLIGTWQGTNVYDVKIADIFPWDRSSASFGQPIHLNTHGIHAMLTDGGYTYVLAGVEGIIYKTNGVQGWPIAQIPQSVCDISNAKYLEPYPGALINFKGRPFFGISSASTDGMGIYSILETSKGTILNFEHSISTETTGGTNPLVIGALLGITRDQLVVGWRDHTTYGIDRTSTASYLHTTAYTKAYFESPLYQVGYLLQPRTFTQLEFYLAKELAANEGIRIRYRVNLTDSFTTIGTYTTTEIGTGKTSFNTTAKIPSCEQLQVRVEMLGTATTTPEFKLLVLK